MRFTDQPAYKENVILKLTFQFAVDIVKYTEELSKNRKFVIGDQLLKSGTSIGANVKESQNAESKRDFIHKLKIALKEVDETEYWLFICNEVESYPSTDHLISQLTEISKVLTKIVTTTNRNHFQKAKN
ncbi:MAG: four helix bundle protein [Cyclobacteriaceae bacterium]|nr:four helix bundle protein [Cyclobacteriaceae bacterium]